MSESSTRTTIEVNYFRHAPGVPGGVAESASGYYCSARSVTAGVVTEVRLSGPFRSSQAADQAAGRHERDLAVAAGRP